jgi:hypothetical protein
MAARTTDEVRRELETERARLGDAVRVLRSQSGLAAKKLSLAALGAAAAGAVTRAVRRRAR